MKNLPISTPDKSYQFYVFILIVHVFFNSILLPEGLLYTMLLSPLIILVLIKVTKNRILIPIFWFTITTSLLGVIHQFGTIKYYIVSSTILFLCFIFYQYSKVMTLRYWIHFEKIIENVTLLNLLLVSIAFVSLVTGIGRNILWYKNEITLTLGFERLRLLTYESSYYSILLVPFILFYFQYYYFKSISQKNLFFLASLLISMMLSLSYGTLGAMVGSIVIVSIFNFFFGARRKYNYKFIGVGALIGVCVLAIMLTFWADSGIVMRLMNIVNGTDTSSNGRAYDSYEIALRVLKQQDSFWFGIGPGQFKVVGSKVLNSYYDYYLAENFDASRSARLPCANAETLVTFGVLGLIARFSIEIYLFFKTKVYSSQYRTNLYVFMFIMQFAGSNLTSLPEYFIWGICFAPMTFPDSFFKKVVVRVPARSSIPMREYAQIESY